MKPFQTLVLAFATLLLGCLPAEPIVETLPEPTITTTINCSGQWNVGPAEPLSDTTQQLKPSKASGQNLLAIQIYAKPIGSPDTQYQPYAYGLFDAWDNLAVELVATNAHKIIASAVVDAPAKLHCYASGYAEPFAAGTENTKVTNAFAYTSVRAMEGLTAGAAVQIEGRSWARYTRPALERTCAALTDFVPAEDRVAELILQRVSFAVKVSAPDLTEGSITLTLQGAPPIVIEAKDATTPIEMILSTLGAASNEKWLDPNYVDPISCTALWKKPDGSRVKIGPAGGITINARRNQRIPIEIYTRGKPSGLQIATEPADWSDAPSVVF